MTKALKSSAAIIAVISGKGGPSKTTTSSNLAVEYASQGLKVVGLDTDPSGAFAKWAAGRTDEDNQDKALVVRTIDKNRVEQVAKELIAAGYDRVIIDTPAQIEAVAIQAARAADLIITPCRPSSLDVIGLAPTISLISNAENGMKKTRILMTQVFTTKGGKEDADKFGGKLTAGYGLEVIGLQYLRVAYKHATDFSLGVTEYAPKSKAATEIRTLAKSVDSALASIRKGA